MALMLNDQPIRIIFRDKIIDGYYFTHDEIAGTISVYQHPVDTTEILTYPLDEVKIDVGYSFIDAKNFLEGLVADFEYEDGFSWD